MAAPECFCLALTCCPNQLLHVSDTLSHVVFDRIQLTRGRSGSRNEEIETHVALARSSAGVLQCSECKGVRRIGSNVTQNGVDRQCGPFPQRSNRSSLTAGSE
jgi:hypothetical protein